MKIVKSVKQLFSFVLIFFLNFVSSSCLMIRSFANFVAHYEIDDFFSEVVFRFLLLKFVIENRPSGEEENDFF